MKKGTVSPARDERDIDFDSLTATFESGGLPRTGPERNHSPSLPTPSEPLSVNTVWGMNPSKTPADVAHKGT